MKKIKVIQIILFCMIIGFAGTWETGSVTDIEFLLETLCVLVVILCLQLAKIKIENKDKEIKLWKKH